MIRKPPERQRDEHALVGTIRTARTQTRLMGATASYAGGRAMQTGGTLLWGFLVLMMAFGAFMTLLSSGIGPGLIGFAFVALLYKIGKFARRHGDQRLAETRSRSLFADREAAEPAPIVAANPAPVRSGFGRKTIDGAPARPADKV